ncbi:MAG: ABC transporter permease [Lachnospiraceae bacterium]|nr:ABC transporter permease [Lachnospiraceae bacterium]
MKKGKGNWNKWLLLLINIGFVIAFILVSALAKGSVNRLYSQQEAKRWGTKKNPYAQVSVFLSPEREVQEEDIDGVRSSIMETLSKDSYSPESEQVRVWIDAYSGECDTTVRKDNNTLSVKAVGVGGDFFQFHPLRLLSGGYISGEDLNHDRIVMDQGLAWALFGSNDIVGMQVWMDNTIYTVAGVVAVEEDALTRTAYGKGNRIYMLYDQLQEQQKEQPKQSLRITCYEAVLPNPISNYAYQAVRDAFGYTEEAEDSLQKNKNLLNFDSIEVVENTNRYEMMKLFGRMKEHRLRSMRTNTIAYPYWENVARVVEEQQQSVLILRLLLLVCPCISLIVLLYQLWIHRTWRAKDLVRRVFTKVRERRENAQWEQDRIDVDPEDEETLADPDIEDIGGEADTYEDSVEAEEADDVTGREEDVELSEEADIRAGEPEPFEEADVMAGEPESSEEADIRAREPEPSEEADVMAGEPESSEEADIRAGEPESSEEADIMAGEPEPSEEKEQDGERESSDEQTDDTNVEKDSGKNEGQNEKAGRNPKKSGKRRNKKHRKAKNQKQPEEPELYSVTNTDIFKA